MAGVIFADLNPANWFDPLGPWERWGLGQYSDSCATSHEIVNAARGHAQTQVQSLAEAHGVYGGAITDRATEALDALNRATNAVWDVVSFFEPGRLLTMLEDPFLLAGRFWTSHNLLSAARDALGEFLSFLGRLLQREEKVLDEIIKHFFHGTTSSSHSPRPIAASPKPSHAVPATPTAGPQPVAGQAKYGDQLASSAAEIASALGPGKYGMYNSINFGLLKGLSAADQTLLAHVLNKSWSASDVECVAFVALTYALAFHNVVIPKLDNASALWDDYAPVNGHPKYAGWQRVENGSGALQPGDIAGSPQPGDILVLESRDPSGNILVDHSHVAIVKSVTNSRVYFYQANTSTTVSSFPIVNGHVDASSWNVSGAKDP
ncbi:MAG: CHAP domain-containing protein, partial [Ktedonobacterales bacterium]